MTNCLFWALALSWRLGSSNRGRLYWRLSHWGPFPHFLVRVIRRDGSSRVVSYVPPHPSKRLVPPLLFKGRVRWGDPPNPNSMLNSTKARVTALIAAIVAAVKPATVDSVMSKFKAQADKLDAVRQRSHDRAKTAFEAARVKLAAADAHGKEAVRARESADKLRQFLS